MAAVMKDEDIERKLRQMAADAFPESSERYERACALAQKAYALAQQAPAASGVPTCTFVSRDGNAACGTHNVDLLHAPILNGWECPESHVVFPWGSPLGAGVPTGAAPIQKIRKQREEMRVALIGTSMLAWSTDAIDVLLAALNEKPAAHETAD